MVQANCCEKVVQRNKGFMLEPVCNSVIVNDVS